MEATRWGISAGNVDRIIMARVDISQLLNYVAYLIFIPSTLEIIGKYVVLNRDLNTPLFSL